MVQTDRPKQNHIQGKVKPVNTNIKLIKGVIMDLDKLPLPGANIVIKGTQKGTVSDFDGNFTLETKIGDTLEVSYIGYKPKEIKVNKKLNEIILLELEKDVLGGISVIVGSSISNQTYIYTPEELIEQKKQRAFAKENGVAFYKRKREKRKEKIRNGEIKRTATGALLFKIKTILNLKPN